MKQLFYPLIFSILLVSCTGSEAEQNDTNETNESTDNDTTTAVSDNSNEEEYSVDFQRIVSAKIGTYQEQAILVLKESPINNQGVITVDGYYFYVKHQKFLDLQGTFTPKTGLYQLTESYKGEETGYMEFVIGNAEHSFWAPSPSSEDQQELHSELLDRGSADDMNIAIEFGEYGYEHEIMFYNGDGTDDGLVTDALKVAIINDEFLAFFIDVTGTNGHVGSVSGVAKITGDKARFSQGEEEWEICDIEFDLSEEDQIIVIEHSCDGWHGAYASFDGVFSKIK